MTISTLLTGLVFHYERYRFGRFVSLFSFLRIRCIVFKPSGPLCIFPRRSITRVPGNVHVHLGHVVVSGLFRPRPGNSNSPRRAHAYSAVVYARLTSGRYYSRFSNKTHSDRHYLNLSHTHFSTQFAAVTKHLSETPLDPKR